MKECVEEPCHKLGLNFKPGLNFHCVFSNDCQLSVCIVSNEEEEEEKERKNMLNIQPQ